MAILLRILYGVNLLTFILSPPELYDLAYDKNDYERYEYCQVTVCRSDNKGTERLKEPKEDSCEERTLDASETTYNDDDEGFEAERCANHRVYHVKEG